MVTNANESYKQFLKVFEQLSYRHSYGDTFSNFLDFALYMLTYEKSEEDHNTMKRLDSTYTDPKEAQLMAQLFQHFTDASDNDGAGFHDVLGDLFMDLVSHGRNGQFFTPQPVCDMMAMMQFGDDLQPGKTVCDPACGSGRMLLAMAKLERKLIFFGADNDQTCAKMAALNMVINTMEGEIAWMNSLSMEHYKSWHIKKRLMGTHYLPMLFTTGKNETRFLQYEKPAPVAEENKVAAEVKEVPLKKSDIHVKQLTIF